VKRPPKPAGVVTKADQAQLDAQRRAEPYGPVYHPWRRVRRFVREHSWWQVLAGVAFVGWIVASCTGALPR
jgi:hypothetical protein